MDILKMKKLQFSSPHEDIHHVYISFPEMEHNPHPLDQDKIQEHEA